MTQESEPTAARTAATLTHSLETLIYFALGAVDFTTEQVRDLLRPDLTRLVERGEQVLENGRQPINTAVDRSKQALTDTRKMAATTADSYAEAALKFVNLPTRGDIDLLQRQLATLERKINQLQTQIAEQARQPDPEIAETMQRIRERARERAAEPVA